MNQFNRQPRNTAVRRIAMVITELRLGGAERIVVHLARSFAGQGAVVQVVCLQEKGYLARELEDTSVGVTALHSHRGYDVPALCRLAALFRDFRPSVVNVHDYASLPYAALAQGIFPCCPLVFSAHGLLYEGFERLRLRYRLSRRRLAALTAVSDQVAQRHRQHLGWKGLVEIIPNGVPEHTRCPQARNRIRSEWNIPAETFVFLAAGNARPEKAFEDLLEAAALLAGGGADPPFEVWIAGYLSETAYCRELLALQDRLQLKNRVRFLGARDDMVSLYSAADGFVLSSRSEGLPLVLLEAMMAGLPLIATRVGGVPAVVKEGVGLLVDPAAPQQLSEAMQTVMTDRPLGTAMGEKAAQYSRANYSLERMAANYLRFFDSITGQNRRKRRGP